ncbi:GNAT family N-acetyltransferase [Aliikangiella maris]|uniref:GNAT family N-acetyltransferase n=2 Tax=Aliikangiella maris TaxID=3162458 RepID=A0ABV3MNU5_9GAMM
MIPTNFTIRSAVIEDLPILLTFEQGIIAAERPFDPCLKESPISYYDIGEMIRAEDSEVLVAENAGEIIASGYAKVLQAKTYLKYQQFAFLGFMFVKPAYRGQGVNQLLTDGLIQWSRSKGLKEIRLQVYNENAGAIRAYEKSGFSRHLIEMRLNLDEQ